MPQKNASFSPYLNLGEFVLALSRAMDMANPQLADHAPRVAAIAHRIGSALGLEEDDLHTLLFSALLHDTGISSSEMKLQAADFDVGLNANSTPSTAASSSATRICWTLPSQSSATTISIGRISTLDRPSSPPRRCWAI